MQNPRSRGGPNFYQLACSIKLEALNFKSIGLERWPVSHITMGWRWWAFYYLEVWRVLPVLVIIPFCSIKFQILVLERWTNEPTWARVKRTRGDLPGSLVQRTTLGRLPGLVMTSFDFDPASGDPWTIRFVDPYSGCVGRMLLNGWSESGNKSVKDKVFAAAL